MRECVSTVQLQHLAADSLKRHVRHYPVHYYVLCLMYVVTHVEWNTI